MKVVQTNIPILNGLTLIFPKPKTWLRSPCVQFLDLSKRYGDVYQILFGTRLIVVANSFDSIKELWCSKNVKGNNSRPMGYSFHKVLSKGVYTVGTTPAGESYRHARKNISETVLCEKRNNDFNFIIMNKACNSMINRLIQEKDKDSIVSNDLLREAQYFHLTVALWLTYGFEFNPEDPVHRMLGEDIIVVENKITKVRSHVQNFVDYLPIPLRFIIHLFDIKSNREFQDLYNTREKYLNMFCSYSKKLYNDVQTCQMLNKSKNIEETMNTIEDLKNTLLYTYFNGNNLKLTPGEITSECLTMVSAGLDNTALNFKYGLHQLVNYNTKIWERGYEELMKSYNGSHWQAYEECGSDMRCDYIKAIVQETLRLFTVLPMSLPRETTCNVIYKNSVIPKGTTLFMNCWAGNHDEKKFPQALNFRPERWLIRDKTSGEYVIDHTMKHLSFGIGCRMCLGYHFAFRELYILFSKMILKFEPVKPTGNDRCITFETPFSDNPLVLNKYPESLAIEPHEFDIVLKVRDTDWDSTPVPNYYVQSINSG